MSDYEDPDRYRTPTPAARVAQAASAPAPPEPVEGHDMPEFETSDKTDLLWPALIAAQGELGIVPTSGHNKFDDYNYARLEDYVAAVRPILLRHGLGLLTAPRAIDRLGTRTTGSGKSENVVAVTIRTRIVHVSGQWVQISMTGDGQDRGDKAIYKALTGARKYAMACLLGAATGDDPEDTKGGKQRDRDEDDEPRGRGGKEPSAPSARRTYREDVLRLLRLLEQVPLKPNQTVDGIKGAWLARAGATDWNGLTDEQVKKGIKWATDRIAEGLAGDVPPANGIAVPAPAQEPSAPQRDAPKEPARTVDPSESQVEPPKEPAATNVGPRKRHHPEGVDVQGWTLAWKQTKGGGNEREAYKAATGDLFVPTAAVKHRRGIEGVWYEMPNGYGVWCSTDKHDSAVWRKTAQAKETSK